MNVLHEAEDDMTLTFDDFEVKPGQPDQMEKLIGKFGSFNIKM